MLSFPDIDHIEQQNNALAIEQNGVGYCLDYSTSPEEILEYIKEIVYNGKFVDNAQSMRQLSEKLNGAVAICKLLEKGAFSGKMDHKQ